MRVWERVNHVPEPQRLIAVLWLSFVMAGIATAVFFAAIDPMDLKSCVDFPEVGRTGAYTVGFLLFWLLTASSSLLCTYFLYPRGAGEADAERRSRNVEPGAT